MNSKEQKNKYSIKLKLIGIIIPMMTIVVSLLIAISYNKSKNIITESANNLLEISIKKQSSQIESWLNENLVTFNAVKTTIENSKFSNEELQNLLDKYYGYSNNYPEGFYIGDQDGNLLKAKNSKKSDKKLLDSVWYKEGLTRLNMSYGTAYKNEDGKDTVSASAILNDKSGKVKIISADIYLDKISVIVNSMIEMDNAESFLVDNSDKTIIAHADNSLIASKIDASNNKLLKEISAKLLAEKYDSCELENNMVAFKKIEGTDWILVSYVPVKSVFSELTNLRLFMIVIAIISILVLVILVERVVQVVIKPIKMLTGTVVAMTNGDFTVDVEVRGNDEISVMLQSVKDFIAVMRNMINKIDTVSNKMNEQAEGSNIISKELYDSLGFNRNLCKILIWL